jgi:hypothetical protein
VTDAETMPLPTPPYTVEELRYADRLMPTKKFPDGSYGGILTDDEVSVWEYLQAMSAARAEAIERGNVATARAERVEAELVALADGRNGLAKEIAAWAAPQSLPTTGEPPAVATLADVASLVAGPGKAPESKRGRGR